MEDFLAGRSSALSFFRFKAGLEAFALDLEADLDFGLEAGCTSFTRLFRGTSSSYKPHIHFRDTCKQENSAFAVATARV